jgi:hypothetical protein
MSLALPAPCMTDEEADLIRRYIQHYRPQRCLEWGIGGSTIHFSAAESIREWIGIEPSREWIDRINAFGRKRITIHHAPTSTETSPYGSVEMIEGYVNHPAVGGLFDFVFIDGDYRWQCLAKAAKILSPGGFCMVHDSARKDMHPHFRHFRQHHILTPGEFNSHGDWHQGLTVLWNFEGPIVL